MHEAETVGGWILNAVHAGYFLGAWFAVVLVYGLWRSRGDAKQDAIRSSGPTGLDL